MGAGATKTLEGEKRWALNGLRPVEGDALERTSPCALPLSAMAHRRSCVRQKPEEGDDPEKGEAHPSAKENGSSPKYTSGLNQTNRHGPKHADGWI